MNLLVKLFLVVTILEQISSSYSYDSAFDGPEKSRFKKFLDYFGIGKDGQSRSSEPVVQYSPNGYPCPVYTTTTTPAPVVLAPFLCPYPPIVPAQIQLPNFVTPYMPPTLPRPVGFDFPPPPSPSLPSPDYVGQYDVPGQFPPNQHPQVPGMFPGSVLPQNPDQNAPSVPVLNLPGTADRSREPLIVKHDKPENPISIIPVNPSDPVKVAQTGQDPTSPIPVIPTPSDLYKPVRIPPTPYDPLRPVQIMPTHYDPTRPVLINPMYLDPTKPLQINPAFFEPFKPIHINPTHIRPNHPLVVDPTNPFRPVVMPGGPLVVDPGHTRPGKPIIVSPGVVQPSHPLDTNDLTAPPSLTPGTLDPPPSTPVRPLDPPPKMRPDPTIPAPPIRTDPLAPPPPVVNEPFTPPPPLKKDPLKPSLPISNGNGQTLPPPPAIDPKGFPKLPPYVQPFGPTDVLINTGIPDSIPNVPGAIGPISTGFPIIPGGHPFPLRPNVIKYPTEVVPFPPIQIPGTRLPTDPILMPSGNQYPHVPGPLCGNPNVKSYVPHGFHVSSVNQYIGVVPGMVATKDLPPEQPGICPTSEMLRKLDFQIMRTLIESSGLLPLLEHTKNYTLFVPSDAAFRRLPKWFRESLEADKKLKKALVLNHLIKDNLRLGLLKNEELVMTSRPGGNRLRINIYQPESTYRTITVDGSEVEKGDILTTNGRLHIIQKVLMPNLPRNAAEFLSEKLEFEAFWNLVKQADMVHEFQDRTPFTLFIPVNEAIDRLDTHSLIHKDKLKNFIRFHMINGTYYSAGLINNEFLLTNFEKEIKVQIMSDGFIKSLHGINNKVKILKSDITLTNGVAHVVDLCISDETPFYVYPESDEFKNEYGVMRRNFRVTNEEKNIENSF